MNSDNINARDSIDRQIDERWMRHALQLAVRGQGSVEPNPMVGCVLVAASDQVIQPGDDVTAKGWEAKGWNVGQAIGQGWHRRYGESHAEVDAIADAHRNGHSERLRDATAYVTMEPCCHQGKTPPCTAALIQAGITRVVVAVRDPNPIVAGTGIDTLTRAGISVDEGVCQEQALHVNAPYFTLQNLARPWVIGKWAMTLDGKIATRTGDSKWISNDRCREIAHQLRGRMDAIVVGIGTVLADDPMLNVRDGGVDDRKRLAKRVVIDRELKLPVSSRLVQTVAEIPVMVFTSDQVDEAKLAELRALGCQVIAVDHGSTTLGPWDDLAFILQRLASEGATNVLVEGGGQTLGAFFDQKLIDEAHIFIAPKLAGGQQAVSPILGNGVAEIGSAPQLDRPQTEFVGDNLYVHGHLRRQ